MNEEKWNALKKLILGCTLQTKNALTILNQNLLYNRKSTFLKITDYLFVTILQIQANILENLKMKKNCR